MVLFFWMHFATKKKGTVTNVPHKHEHRPAGSPAHNTAAAGAWCLAHYYTCTVRISMRVASMRIYYLHTCMLICYAYTYSRIATQEVE